MEKTIQIVIASTAFNCSEEAYAKLSEYLERLKTHFKEEADSMEIIRDIESRIAEKLLEQNHLPITIDDVKMVIAEVGDVSQIDDVTEAENEARAEKRLYRDSDSAFVAGVAGGIAAYFGVPPILVRFLFLISIFFGGTGIIVYIILWIVIPEAKTSAQKLQMYGKAVTFESISETVKTRIAQNQQSGVLKSAASFVHTLITRVLQFSAKALGLLIACGSFIAIIGLTVFVGIILTNWNAPYNDLPFRESSSTLLLVTTLVSGFFATIIPLLFIFALGYQLLRDRMIIPAVLGFALIGVWSLALVGVGVSGTKIAGDFYTHLQTSPQYETVTQMHTIDPVERIVATNARVRMQQGDTYEVVIEGQTRDIGRVTFATADSVLTIDEHHLEECLFCGGHSHPTVTVTVPDITSVEVTSGSLTFDNYTDAQLQVTANDASIRGSLEAGDLMVTTKDSSFRADLAVQSLTLKATDTSLTLSGEAETADLTLQNATLYADTLVIQNATLNASDSYAELDVRGTFEQNMDEESNIILEEQTTSAQ